MGDERPAPRRAGWVTPAAASLVAGAIALHDLGRRSIWLDEALSVEFARQGPRQFVEWVAGRGGEANMSAYYALLAPVVRIADSEWAIRLPSVLAFMLLVAATWWIARRLFGTAATTVATVAMALSPLAVRYAQEARGYVFAAAAFAVACAAGIDEGGRRRGVVAGVGLAAAAWFHAVTLVGAPVVLLAAHAGGGWGRVRSVVRTAAAPVFVLLALMRSNRQSVDFIPDITWDLVRHAAAEMLGVTGWLAALVAVVLLAGAGAYAARRRPNRRLGSLPLAWLAGPVLLLVATSLAKPLFLERYLVFVTPRIALAAGAADESVVAASRPRHAPVAGALLAVVVWPGVAPAWDASSSPPLRDMRAAAGHVASMLRDDETVVVTNLTAPDFRYYADRLDAFSDEQPPIAHIDDLDDTEPDSLVLVAADTEPDAVRRASHGGYCAGETTAFAGVEVVRLRRC